LPLIPSLHKKTITVKKKSPEMRFVFKIIEKSLKIPKGKSESVNRRTDNKMGQKKPKTIICKTLHRKLMIKHHELHKNQG
jgi:hypothetical protein